MYTTPPPITGIRSEIPAEVNAVVARAMAKDPADRYESCEEFLRELLDIPQGIRPVAWLCLGPVSRFQQVPDLERHGWRARTPLADVVHTDRFGVH